MQSFFRRIVLLTAVLAASVALDQPVLAQDDADARTRQQRLRDHEARIRQIIEERRREEGSPGPPPETLVRPGEELVQEPPQEEFRGAVSSVVVGLKFTNEQGVSSYNIMVNEGDEFLSEVFIFNIDQNPIDRIRLAIQYDKRFIEPVRVFDASIANNLVEPPRFGREERDAILYYDGTLRRYNTNPEIVPLSILWRAVRATPYAGITFAFDPLEEEDSLHTAIYAKGENILGVRYDYADGVLSGGLMIDIPEERRNRPLQGKREDLREIYLGSIASDDSVGLVLVPPREEVRVGDDFVVKVRLNNPYGALVDNLHFAVKYDPNVLEVIDTDQFNYISRGTNIHDGPYHYSFPWDIHKRNEVREETGVIIYQKSLTNGGALPSRTIADIHFRAKSPTAGTEVFFIEGTRAQVANTSVRYFGFERLSLGMEYSNPILQIPVKPQPLTVTQAPGDQEPEAEEAPSAPLPPVRPLLLER